MESALTVVMYLAAASAGFLLGLIYTAACEAWREHEED